MANSISPGDQVSGYDSILGTHTEIRAAIWPSMNIMAGSSLPGCPRPA